MRYRGEVWQGGIRVAMVEANDVKSVMNEAIHYAMMYREDGPRVEVKLVRERAKRKLQGKTK